MAFKINFSCGKPGYKPINDNVHDQFYWDIVHELFEATTPVNQWPRQFTVHYLYELMNRPWLPKEDRLRDAFNWMSHYAPDLNFQAPDLKS